MRIGELAVKSGVSASSIRFYEKLGLLPKPKRRASGYREYDNDALTRLELIKLIKFLGLPLHSLLSLTDMQGNWDHDELIHTIDQQSEGLSRLIAECEKKNALLANIRALLLVTWGSNGCVDVAELKLLVDEYALSTR